MEGTIQLEGGGRLTFREEGIQVRMEAARPDDRRGLYKVWIRGSRGRLLLGTLAPEQGELRLCRRLSRHSLEQSGCWPLTGGEAALAFPFGQKRTGWVRTDHPEKLLRDGVLRKSAADSAPMLLRQGEAGFRLAARYDSGRPFPLIPLFCMAEVGEIQERPYLIFSFDGEGNPVPPHNRGEGGNTNR